MSISSDSFTSPYLQFGFEKGLSTTLCSWTLLESTNYFTNRGSPIYMCLLDLTKAFDHVKHHILFKKLSLKLPPVFLRIVIVSYLCQICSVKWENFYSDKFSVSNGVRQGAVASPLYFNIYLVDLFAEMRDSGLGCYIDGFFYGLLGYADDCALISPSRDGLQRMLDICVRYFLQHGIKISVNAIAEQSKTKCLAFNVKSEPASLMLYNYVLPWVQSATHLGHIIHTKGTTDIDILKRRGEFIGKTHSLRQEFGAQNPIVFMRLVQTYLSSMYGSNLWDLYSAPADRLYTTWNILLRTAYELPYKTHRYIVYNLGSIPHLRVSLIRRFMKFYHKLESCSKLEVKHLFNIQKADCRSIFGRNCFNICRESRSISISNINFRDITMPIKIQEDQKWRLPFLVDLLLLRDSTSPDIPVDDINYMIDFITCST